MVDAADAVAAIVAHHRIAGGFGHFLDRVADVAQARTRTHGANARHHALEGGVDQALRLRTRGAGIVHAAGIAVPSVLDHGDVDVDDVAVLQDVLFARDAVADHAVDRGAQRLREAVVADIRRRRLLHLADVVVAAPVEFLGGDAGDDVFLDHFQHLGRHAPGDAHLRDVLVVLEFDCHVCSRGSRGRAAQSVMIPQCIKKMPARLTGGHR